MQTLYDAGTELLVSGHDHVYERFAPQTPTARPDPDRGIRQIIVGTGGGAALHSSVRPGRGEQRTSQHDTLGVVRLTLLSGSYRWDFLPVAGETFSPTPAPRYLPLSAHFGRRSVAMPPSTASRVPVVEDDSGLAR